MIGSRARFIPAGCGLLEGQDTIRHVRRNYRGRDSRTGDTSREHPAPADADITAELQARIAAVRQAAGASGGRVLAPLLMLGTMERVGSNWMSDSLRPLLGQHNEPWRQQLGGSDHPLSALHPAPRELSEAGCHLGAYARHRLVSFAADAYASTQQVTQGDEPVLRAARPAGRHPVACVPYELAVLRPDAAWRRLAELIPELDGTRRPALGGGPDAGPDVGPEPAEDTFATVAARTELLAHLDVGEAELVRATAAATLNAARTTAPTCFAARCRTSAAGASITIPKPADGRSALVSNSIRRTG